ncbi:MAG TPA: polyphosphate kinase 1, partial [Puia sp.]|nr:polyphosphate kinase 1 [Puia sp.]
MTENLSLQSTNPPFFDRDLSWLSFNERVLIEAEKEHLPVLERLKFLAIYSSNLDEFYRVRMTAILAENDFKNSSDILSEIKSVIDGHLHRFGAVLTKSIIPNLISQGIIFLYDEEIPAFLHQPLSDFFYAKIAGLLEFTVLEKDSNTTFKPENNKIYFVATTFSQEKLCIINIPSDRIPRFYNLSHSGETYVLMIDDIIRIFLPVALGGT